MRAVLMVVIALVPLVIAPGYLLYFDITPKVIIVLLGAALVLPICVRNLQVLFQSRAGRWFLILLALEFVSLAISTWASANPPLSVTGSNWRRLGLATQSAVLILAAAAAGDAGGARLVLGAICATGIPVALYGILQYLGWDPWLPRESYRVGEGIWQIVRPPGTLGYAAYFGNYLVFVVFAGIALAGQAWRRRFRLCGVAAAALGSTAIVLSGTRAAIVAVLFGLILLRPKISRLSAAIAALGIVCAAMFYFSPFGQPLRARTRWYLEDLRGGARLLLWRDSVKMGVRHWLSGSGPETFSAEFARNESAELARAYPNFYHESPHNIFLDAWISEGAAGVALLLAVSALGLYAAVRSGDRTLAAGLGAVLVAHQFTSFILPTALLFYVWVGLTVAKMKLPDSRGSARVRLLFVPVSAALLYFAVRVVVADRLLAETDAAIHARDSGRVTSLYDRARRWSPPGMNSDLWFSRAASVVAPARAFQAAVEAVASSEEPQNANYNLAMFCAAANDFARTEQALRAAIVSAPNWYKPHWTLARLLHAAGRNTEARTQAAAALYLNAGRDAEIGLTLRELNPPKEK